MMEPVPEPSLSLSTTPPERGQRRTALAALALSALFLAVAAPFAQVQFQEVWGFLPVYQSALITLTLVTAIKLYGLFLLLRSRALLVLAAGYLFSAVMATAHLLSFPRLFAPGGLLAANPQTTAWLYFLWHCGFGLFVAAYAWLKDGPRDVLPDGLSNERATLAMMTLVAALAAGLIWVATGSAPSLPALMAGDHDLPAKRLVTLGVMATNGLVLAYLWRRRERSLLDLWLTAVIAAWLFDITLAALLNHGRFDGGWYAGRIYGLLANGFVLGLLLHQTNRLYLETARRRAEERRSSQRLLEASEARFHRLYESRVLGMIAWTMDGDITDANDIFLEMLGYSRSELAAGKLDWTRLTPPEFRAQDEAGLQELRTTGANRVPLEKEFFRKDGSRIPVLVAAITLDQSRSHGLAFVLDITQRKSLEAQLQEEARRKDEFLAQLGHELRNPLAPMRNSLAVLRRLAPDDGPARGLQEIMERQVAHLTRLVDDLLDVSRITTGKITLERETLDLVRTVRQVVEDHRAALEAGGLTVEFKAAAGPVWVQGDRARLSQVVGNLLANTGKFTNRGGRLRIEVRRPEPDRAEIEVADTGIGMDTDMLRRLFEPFVQGEATRHRSPAGLGLGLALAKGLLELHDGRIEARSDGPDQGSTFTVTLPACPAPEPAPAAPVPDGPAGRCRRVLVVEDNRDAALSLKLLLEFLGHRVDVAGTGREGLDLARSGRPEVVFCDIGLPDLDGHAVARALRADPASAPAHLVALTGFGQEEDKRRALEAGFDHHLTKPADPGLLVQLLEALS